MKNKTAIIIGATGLTGGLLLERLINDDDYINIKLFSRKSVHSISDKVQEFIGDIIELDNFKDDFVADEVYCCIGTTKAKTKDQTVYKAIDYGIPAKAALLAQANDINTFMVISALGADAKSKVFYNRTKGEMEDAVRAVAIPNIYILRPSLIVGNRSESRLGEDFASIMMKILNPFFIGSLKKYRAINADDIAKCMHKLALGTEKEIIIESDRIKYIANH